MIRVVRARVAQAPAPAEALELAEDELRRLPLPAGLREGERLVALLLPELVDDPLGPAPARCHGLAVLRQVAAGQRAVQLRAELLVGEALPQRGQVVDQLLLRAVCC